MKSVQSFAKKNLLVTIGLEGKKIILVDAGWRKLIPAQRKIINMTVELIAKVKLH